MVPDTKKNNGLEKLWLFCEFKKDAVMSYKEDDRIEFSS